MATILDAKSFNPAVEVELPSMRGTGNVVLLRKPDLYSLLDGNGETSDPLTNMLMGSLAGKVEGTVSFNPQELLAMIGMLDRICVATFVSPKVTLDADGGETHLPARYITLADKQFVMGWAMGADVYNKTKSFRQQPPSDVEIVSEGEGI
jgi:hypothetical protein